MICPLHISHEDYGDAIQWFPNKNLFSTPHFGGRRTLRRRQRKQKRAGRQAGGSAEVTHYIPDTLEMSRKDFTELWPSRQRLSTVGSGRFGVAYKMLLGIHTIISKDLRECISQVISPTNIDAHNMQALIEKEATALSELMTYVNARKYIPPFVGLVITDTSKHLATPLPSPALKSPVNMNSFELFFNDTNYATPQPSKMPKLSLNMTHTESPRTSISFVYKYINGDTLENIKNTRSEILTDDLLNAIRSDGLTALNSIHSAGWMHRDIKPDNLFAKFDASGNYTGLMLLDFGCAERVDAQVEAIGPIFFRSARLKADITANYIPRDDVDSLEISMNYLNSGAVNFAPVPVAAAKMPKLRLQIPLLQSSVISRIPHASPIKTRKRNNNNNNNNNNNRNVKHKRLKNNV
jgi:serine/threonine protein kinase